jgi:hypothetical protein
MYPLTAVLHLKNKLKNLSNEEFYTLSDLVTANNTWFTEAALKLSLEGIVEMLDEVKINEIIQQYTFPVKRRLKVGLILAGNIPAVGFHDVLSVLIAGHFAQIKLSSSDQVLIPWLLKSMQAAEPSIQEQYCFTDSMKEIEALIVTGNDQTAKHFEFYFKHIPTIIRKNRTSLAVLSGHESVDELKLLGKDVFSYYGLGCRNVTYLLTPEGYDFTHLLNQWNDFFYVINNSKYSHNYDYNKSIFLINKVEHLDNGFLLLRPSNELHSALSVLHYSTYKDEFDIQNYISSHLNEIQCVVGANTSNELERVPFGNSQCPTIYDFADGINTFDFLKNISE